MTANVITYRGRSATREVGKALGLSTDVLDRFSGLVCQRRFSAHHRTCGGKWTWPALPVEHPRWHSPLGLVPLPFTGCRAIWASIPAA